MEQEMKMVMKEPLEEMQMADRLFGVKGEPLLDDEESLTTFASPLITVKDETCECAEDCLDCIEAQQSEQRADNVSMSPSSVDDFDSMPSDWFCDASSDSGREIVTVSDDSVSNFSVKEDPHPHEKESLPIFASTQPASPLIAIKGETCPGDNCLDCLEALQTDQTDTEEAIIDASVNVSPAPVSNFIAKTLKRSHPCPECGKAFASNAALTIHLRVHTGERPYVCAQCSKAFKVLAHLRKHQVTHQAVRRRPFLCTADGCGKAFTTRGELTVHSRSHTGERPYQCDICGKSCSRNFDLKVHFRTHTGEKPYQCPLCPRAFSSSSNAISHQRNVHARSPPKMPKFRSLCFICPFLK